MLFRALPPLILLITLASAGAIAPPQVTAGLPAQVALIMGPRPNIEHYDNRDEFVRDILAWERRREELESAWLSGKLNLSEPDESDLAHDWHHVTGPEDLETAIQNAEGYEQPHYLEQFRFNRTTHVSFPLDPLAPEQMASRRVEPPADQPEGVEDMMAQELVTVDESGYLVLAPAPEPSVNVGDFSNR